MLKQNTLIQLQAISKSFGYKHDKTKVLSDVSLSIYKGEFLAITGPSGSGKTTLTHIIGGLITPDEGTVSMGGRELKKRSDKAVSRYRNEKVGFVFQNFSLIPHYTALENVTLPLVVSGISVRKRQQRAIVLLKTMGLERRMYARASVLSGGERQRVSIARALIMQPDIIIADEPTGSLDSRRGSEVMAILRDLNTEQAVTVLMVTHDPALAKQADRTLHILDGKIEKEVTNANV